jgi:GTP pyrophosphokinase
MTELLPAEAALPGAFAALAAADAQRLRAALAHARACYGAALGAGGQTLADETLAAAEILLGLGADAETLTAAVLAHVTAIAPERAAAAARLRERYGDAVARLADGVAQMNHIHALSRSYSGEAAAPGSARQLEALRKMLLAMVQDVRVVIVRLALELATLRALTRHPDERLRQREAQATFDLYAPLANRLGLWQLKWELEDLAFRLSEPAIYQRIAKLLDEKRGERERFVAEVMATLRAELAASGIRGEISGRPKHIYSIWRKMRRKGVEFGELHDVTGVRVLVDSVRDCYTVLGLVHNRWTPIPGEFDDYIARPKGNDYRSLHTAVIGPGERALEVQIRTHAMHEHAEYGVAAHWRYKEAGRPTEAREPYQQKIAWLRRVLDWRDELAPAGGSPDSLSERFRTELFDDTVYVLTPQGQVIDLPAGATPVDFAYALHTELGHRCRGAKVDGAIVPLNFPLANGQRVEIIAAKEGGPSRDWLNPALGYTRSSRARNKVRQWFNAQNLAASIAQGRIQLERELQRHGMTAVKLDDLAARLGYGKLDEALAAVARGEVNQRQIAIALGAVQPAEAQPGADAPIVRPSRSAAGGRGILIVGVDRLLTALARCCKPAPPDPIVGYVSRGRGVVVHRADCPNVTRMGAERRIEAGWGELAGERFPVDLVVEAHDRQGLLRDISEVISREKVNVTAVRTHSRGEVARMQFTVEVLDRPQVGRLFELVEAVPGVFRVRRV